jgi:23S rRNA (uracil1939-C5)-methyltransferase
VETITLLWPQQSEERLYYELPEFGLKIGFHPSDFTQVNADINRAMLNKALSLLELNEEDTVLDLFCGLGNFTLPLATRCQHVIGIEAAQEMVDRGYENAFRNQLGNVSVTCADLFKPVEGDWLDSSFTKVLLDPPRSGAQEILPLIADKRPQRIVYVSCNPATLARDAAILAEKGYRLASAGVMDMFPHTTHVESIALFLPVKSA